MHIIGDYAFAYNQALTDITVGVADGTGSDEPTRLRADRLTLSPHVREIGEYAFCRCPALTKVALPKELGAMGEGAFSHCTALTEVDLPGSIIDIGAAAFAHCTALRRVRLGRGTLSIQSGVFRSCTALDTVSLPDSLEVIESGVFEGCCALTELVIPKEVTTIGSQAFRGCSSLKRVVIEGGRELSIAWGAFIDCPSLTEIVFKRCFPARFGDEDCDLFRNGSGQLTLICPAGNGTWDAFAQTGYDGIARIDRC